MKQRNYRSKLILVILVAIIATTVSYSVFNHMTNQIQEQSKLIELMQKTQVENIPTDYTYVVSTKDLLAGELISDSDIEFASSKNMNTSAFEDKEEVVNKILLKDIKKGETFTTNHIAKISSEESTLSAGYRALTLPIENFTGKSQSMKIGSKVDIYADSTNGNWNISGIKIIGFEGNDVLSKADIMQAKAITFEVNANDIADFISNASNGKMVLVQRNQNEKITYKKSGHYKSSTNTMKYDSISSYSSLPPIQALPSYDNNQKSMSNLEDLPQPVSPKRHSASVELIEANVKTNVEF